MAILAVPAMAQNAGVGGADMADNGGTVDGIFDAGDKATITFPVIINGGTNVDFIETGNDAAFAVGNWWANPPFSSQAVATNEITIDKSQDSEGCNCSPVFNFERIKVGDHNAQAFGSAAAKNKVTITTSQS
ncbi:MAG: hypothetical protein GKC10_02655 [Methanosarcinales archaeon]|nr:hypothetical protein [Methanosarcinales archaeon]